MSDIYRAEELVSKYFNALIDNIQIGKFRINAIECAKIDLTNRIELLNRLYIEFRPHCDFRGVYDIINKELQSLENQLIHLNNL